MDDVIDHLVGITPGSRLDAVRAQRLQARENAQRSFRALFEPVDAGAVSVLERLAVAAFVAGLHREPAAARFYAVGLAEHDEALAVAVAAEVGHGAACGPYGRYPAGPLSAEDRDGPVYRVADRGSLGPRLAAAFEHAHLLVFRPRDAAPPALQALIDAGWTTDGIVTLSQLVAFLAFQVRVVAGLRVLAA